MIKKGRLLRKAGLGTAVLWLVVFPAAGAAALDLTAAEIAYLRRVEVVRVCVDPDWEPFERLDEQGRHVGIAADLLALAARRAGLALHIVPTASWAESLDASRQRRCDVLSFLNQTPEREAWLRFTRPLLEDPNVFITREEHPPILDPNSLRGESIVFPEGTAMEQRIRRDYPHLQVRVTDSEESALALVAERQADMTLRSLIVAAYTIRKNGWFTLKIAGKLPHYANQLRVGVVKEEPMLRDLLDKAIASITDDERDRIVNTHVPIAIEKVADRGLIALLLSGFALAATLAGWLGLRLRRRNQALERLARTDTLTGLPNRALLDDQLDREIRRARRSGLPFSLILVDIDHFKTVNDRHGHLVGDRVLSQVARLATPCLRGEDVLGRWGGEEFLILCPGTDASGAHRVAERLRKAMEEATFETQTCQTLSAGIASLRPDDTTETLLSRADAALYAAKDAGRNRICREP